MDCERHPTEALATHFGDSHETLICNAMARKAGEATELLEAVKTNEVLKVEVTWPVFGPKSPLGTCLLVCLYFLGHHNFLTFDL